MKVLFVSDYSRALTGFGKNMKNVLRRLHEDPDFEVVEAANGGRFGADLKTPWKSYGTYPSDFTTLREIENDPYKKRMAMYGNYTIDKIVDLEKPDVVVGIEDIWAFKWEDRKWFGKIGTVLWTTLDSSPILDLAYDLAPKVDKFLVWASFAQKEMRNNGYNVETLHGAIDLSSFFPLLDDKRKKLRKENNVDDSFLVGFVFKNQLRKSVPNLLEGFKRFKQIQTNAKLLLHTEWCRSDHGWDIVKYLKEKNINKKDVLVTYICKSCKKYHLSEYHGEDSECKFCKQKTCVSKSPDFGVSESELNEIYNMMDVYCHPFTSGGQELPIQEAKAAGLITLVTEYSCGTDNCYPEQGGLPLKWTEYREPNTQFIKATTCPDSIKDQLLRVSTLSEEEKVHIISNGRRHIEEYFSVDKTVEKLKQILLEIGKTNWNFKAKEYDPNYVPSAELSDKDWITDLYKGMFDKDFNENSPEIREGVALIKQDGRPPVYDYLRNVALERIKKPKELSELLDGNQEDRIAVVVPESAGDVLIVNSLMENLKKLYPKKDIYFFTKPEFFPMIYSNPHVYKVLPYNPKIDNMLVMEGQGGHKGYFHMSFLPTILTQKVLGYLHQGEDKDVFNIIPKIK